MALRLRVVTGKITDAKGVPIQSGQVTFTLTEPIGYTSTHVVVDPFVFATTDALGEFSISLWADEDSLTPVNYTVNMPIVNSGPALPTHEAVISLAYEAGTPKDIGTLIAESQPPPSETDDAVWRDLIDSRIDLAVINDLADVVITAPADGHVIEWDSATSKWMNQAPGGDGGMAIGGTVTGGTVGSVLFVGAAGLAQDNGNFFYDPAINQLKLTAGAATDVPLLEKLAAAHTGNAFEVQLNGSVTPVFRVTASGNMRSGGGTTPGVIIADQGDGVGSYVSLQQTAEKAGLFRSVNSLHFVYYDTVTGDTVIDAANNLDLRKSGLTSGRFDASVTAGQTRFLIYDVDNATLERVSVGAADSGGAGFKLLRIPN